MAKCLCVQLSNLVSISYVNYMDLVLNQVGKMINGQESNVHAHLRG